jgi:anti-sigma regulatory factor (Ser/Thr protein kinase)
LALTRYKGHQVTFAQPTNVTYAPGETQPPDLIPLVPELPVSYQTGPGPFVAHGDCRVLLPSDPESAKAAREFTVATLRTWQLSHVIDDAEIIATELVTNAIKHGACCAGSTSAIGPVELVWQRDTGRVVCVVTDGNSQPPVLVAANPDSECGRGLQVVQALASSWGWMKLGATQKAVWAAIYLAAGGLSRPTWRLPAPSSP